MIQIELVCDHEFGVRCMRVSDGTESELQQQAAYQDKE